MGKLTELEKTILLAVLSTTKGKQYVRKDSIVLKFIPRQRKMVGRYFEKLVKGDYMIKHPASDSYKLSEAGLKRAMKLLSEGATLWRVEEK